MKNVMLIFLITIVMIGCKKSSQKTSSTTTPTPTNNQTTLNDTSLAKAALIGHWILDSMVYYQNDVPTIVKHTSVATTDNYVYDLFSTPYTSSSQPQMQMNYGLSGGTQNSGAWWVNGVWLSTKGKLFLTSSGTFMPGYIYLLNTTHLMTADNYATVKQGYCYYMHK